jgi:hypothetical protein
MSVWEVCAGEWRSRKQGMVTGARHRVRRRYATNAGGRRDRCGREWWTQGGWLCGWGQQPGHHVCGWRLVDSLSGGECGSALQHKQLQRSRPSGRHATQPGAGLWCVWVRTRSHAICFDALHTPTLQATESQSLLRQGHMAHAPRLELPALHFHNATVLLMTLHTLQQLLQAACTMNA